MYYLKWKLKWEYKPDKKYDNYLIEDIHAICPKCNCRLAPIEYPKTDHKKELYCPICRDEFYDNFELYEAVRIVINHRIETKNYSEAEI